MANMSTAKTGKHLVVLGLVLQIFFFSIFILTSSIFHHRLSRSPTSSSTSNNWTLYMSTLYFASSLILIRSVFRVIEFSGGNDGVLLRNEVFLYVFDALLMFGVVLTFNIIHPGRIIGGQPFGVEIQMVERGGEGEGAAMEQKVPSINGPA